MLSQTLFQFVSLALLGYRAQAAPGSLREVSLASRAAQICYDNENKDLLCYNLPDGVLQNVAVANVAYIASYLHAYGAQTKAGRLFNFAGADAPNCGEWSVYAHGSALAIAKHINNAVNTSVLFADIANTIDGGAGATTDQKAAAIIGCGTSGGSRGVAHNASNPAYSAATYPAGSTPDGILLKIVASGA